MLKDMPLEELRRYQGNVAMPDDFDAFWQRTLAESRAAAEPLDLTPVPTRLKTVDVYDLTFPGFAGQPVKAWVRAPHGETGPLPAVVSYVGYGGGRGLPMETLLWASAGYVHVHMDTRGQGSGWSVGETPDFGPTGPAVAGVCTRGIDDRETYYYRRLFTDAVLAVDAARQLPMVDAARIGTTGGSQGGAMALASAALATGVKASWISVPFMSDVRRAVEATDTRPYAEFAEYLACHRDQVERVYATLAYFDGVNFARRASVPAVITAALMDDIVPASTVFAVHHNYAGPNELVVWSHNGHEAGGPFEDAQALDFFADRL
ncbi:MAG: acetylxylan esterase [Propionibacteriaceae bacterium]|jgi:cephalosporin-C deacetylase|nr:acetylxylan esterase [Propionibacteriaceae bacterium]